MKANIFYGILKKSGFGPFVGVPCSILAPFLAILPKQEQLIATSEGEAIGIASGLYLAGKSPVVFMQNSGLCNASNPLTSLNLIYKIPLLLIVTLRGEPGTKDAPEHKIMGRKTKGLLQLLDIPYRDVADDAAQFEKDLHYLKKKLKEGLKPVAFILRRNALEKGIYVKEKRAAGDYKLTRQATVNEVAKMLDENCLVISTTGKITREYYYCKEKAKSNFYMVGSMGCASAIGLGVAMATKESARRVVVLDGDAAVLMKMGNLASIGNVKPKNLIHIVLDNQCHESTGGQESSSSTACLDKIAKSCGYLNVYRPCGLKEIRKAVKKALHSAGPNFILIKIARTVEKEDRLGRPKEPPEQIKQQFINQIIRKI